MVTELRTREVTWIGREIELQTGMLHIPVAAGAGVRGTVWRTVETPDARYAVIARGQEVHVAPWTNHSNSTVAAKSPAR